MRRAMDAGAVEARYCPGEKILTPRTPATSSLLSSGRSVAEARRVEDPSPENFGIFEIFMMCISMLFTSMFLR